MPEKKKEFKAGQDAGAVHRGTEGGSADCTEGNWATSHGLERWRTAVLRWG